jgi:L-asparaginase
MSASTPDHRLPPAAWPHVLVLGTGGTIAGSAAEADDHVGYTAGQIGVAQLLAAVPALRGVPLVAEQVAQIDSKDMSHAVWRRLAQRIDAALRDDGVQGIVVTHGTDTLEETAYLLQRVLAPAKPVVMTAAMRPATALAPDGPQNLADAVTLAREPGVRGVVVAAQGAVWSPLEVRKTHSYRLDAFGAGDAGPLAWIEQGRVRRLRDWPAGEALGVDVLAAEVWPDVQIVTSHAGADARVVDWLVEAGVQGLVVAATGNGTVHQELAVALLRAQARGVAVLRATRVGAGQVIAAPGEDDPAGTLPGAGGLTPVQARVELLLQRLRARQNG